MRSFGMDDGGTGPRMLTLYGQFNQDDFWTKERRDAHERHWIFGNTASFIMCCIILSNAFVLGAEIDYPNDYEVFFGYMEIVFCIVYFWEMALKVYVE
jgi:hypothetical protein